ncbi:hypothetical protein PCANC_12185 [Puccinia coronata f. sp. avenae]|uniref:Uncharacterized protein n=1 Tax=Puccinia coronata f. sp. avenae TaxID=200324 RepID=A0A2N5VEW0_9BASI|nr:hypothetical protein PCANC_12185 [Puccinia coronata f. sp. avenae]
MSSVKPPNHSTMVMCIFEAIARSVPNPNVGSQYGFVNTQSYIQCNGILGDKPNNFERENFTWYLAS